MSSSLKENLKPRGIQRGNQNTNLPRKTEGFIEKGLSETKKYDKLHRVGIFKNYALNESAFQKQMNVLEDCAKADQHAKFLTLAHPEKAYNACLLDFEDEQYEIIKDEERGWRMSSKKCKL